MKPPASLLLVLLLSCNPAAGGEREWTGSGDGGRTIKGELIEKGIAGDKPTILLQDGKRITIELAKLSPQDQDYVRQWVSPAELITTTIDTTTKSTGFKTILVQFAGGVDEMTLICSDEKATRKTVKVKAGETGEFRWESKGNYKVVAMVGAAEMDAESQLVKTGKLFKRK